MARVRARMLTAVLALSLPTLAGAAMSTTPTTEPTTPQQPAPQQPAPQQDAEGTYVDSRVYPDEQYNSQSFPSGSQVDNKVPWQSKLYPFENRTYTQDEKNQIIADEQRLTGGTYITEDGQPTFAYPPKTISEAYTQNTPPAVESRTATDMSTTPVDRPMEPAGFRGGETSSAGGGSSGSSPFTRGFYRSEGFGNDLFGARYTIDTAITATPATSGAAKRLDAYADGLVTGTAFFTTKELAHARVEVSGQQGGANSGTAKLYTLGQQIYSANLYATYAPAPIDWSRTFFNASKTFMVGPIGVTVKASLAGGVRLSASGQIGPTVAKIAATPGGYASVSASASVNVIVGSFGVKGNLMLVNASLPSSAELFWPYCTLDWKLQSTLNANFLSGELKAYVKIGAWIFAIKYEKTIASWNGINKNVSLINITGSTALGTCAVGKSPEPAYVSEM